MTEMGTSWMFCSRFCAVTMISVSAGWLVVVGFAVVWAQPEPAGDAAGNSRLPEQRLVAKARVDWSYLSP